MNREPTGSGLDQEKFLKMFSPGDVIHWKEAIWTERPQYGRPRLAGEQEATGRIVSLTDKTANIEILAAEITDARLPGSAQAELVPYGTGSVIRKRISTLLKGNVARTLPPKKKEPPVLKTVVNNDGQGSKVGRNDPCPCGSEKKYKKCCGNTVMTPETEKAAKAHYEFIETSSERCIGEVTDKWKVFHKAWRRRPGRVRVAGDSILELYEAAHAFADEIRPWIRKDYSYMVWNQLKGTDERLFWMVINTAVLQSRTCNKSDVKDVFMLIREEEGITEKGVLKKTEF